MQSPGFEVNGASAWLLSEVPATTPAPNWNDYHALHPLQKAEICGVATLVFFVLVWLFSCIKPSIETRTVVRFVSFVVLHCADYTTNVLTMYIVYITHHGKYLAILLPVHLIIGIFCIYTAFQGIEWKNWSTPQPLSCFLMVVVMGFMQGVQVKLAHDDFQDQRAAAKRSQEENELAIPSMMHARFHLKAMDGVLEGTAFAFVAMYALLKNQWLDFDGFALEQWEMWTLYISAASSFLNIGLALMEVDWRVSAAVHRMLDPSNLLQVRHLLFRSSEVALRLLTVLVFCTFMRPLENAWWVAFVLVGVDYLLGVILLLVFGGRDPIREAAVLLAVPLFMVNVMQFVDTPGMALQAQRISNIITVTRTIQLIGVLVFVSSLDLKIRVDGTRGNYDAKFSNLTIYTDGSIKACAADPMCGDKVWNFMLQDHTEWVFAWAMFGFFYYTLLFCYAWRLKPEADLHLAVANNDIETLNKLLSGSELVLDVNRYGPDGRTPLHLAAVRSKVECMQLLIEQNADIHKRTGDAKQHTALHLAVMNKDPSAVSHLCLKQGSDASFVNARNVDGDTALHVAARRQNVGALKELLGNRMVDIKIRNNAGHSAADCAPSDKFGFDRDSSECAITEIFRDAEAGRLPGSSNAPTTEMSAMEGASSSSTTTAQSKSPSKASNLEASADSATPMADEAGEAEAAAKESQNQVELIVISEEAEQEFMKRQGSIATGSMSRPGSAPPTNMGISSFMLSAGLGALSRAFLNSIREDEELGDAESGAQVKASFDDFTEIKPIGEGAFGKVILVKHRESGELFAMKLMDKAKFKAQKITSKAVSEQYILKTTRHPFIVALQYAFQGSTFWALVMEYCPNGDLMDLLVAKGTPGMALRECARLGGEVLLGVEHLHRISVIFRDLKLENVVLDPNDRAKLTDFGLAKKLYTSTDARTMCGSYGYAAPEIMLNTGRYTYAVDLYSYGVMMFMLLSGGEPAPNNPKQRLPPMRHSSLRRKLKSEGDKEPRALWASEKVHAHELLMNLTSEEPRNRTTCTEVKKHIFFKDLLQHDVDDLLAEIMAEDAKKAADLAAEKSGAARY